MSLFDELKDESPATVASVSETVAEVMKELHQQNTDLAETLASAIASAIRTVESKNITVNSAQADPIRAWVFKVQRDQRGLITSITATAGA